jgi:predicted dithiol-disulfide oxidoreductase (DUF899 family)
MEQVMAGLRSDHSALPPAGDEVVIVPISPDTVHFRAGYSCFLREGGEIFHTYSAYGRGTEYIGNAYTLLDLTALGRQEDWEEPKGRIAPIRGGDPTFTS